MEMVVRSRSSPLICQIFISKRLISSGGEQLFGAAIVVYSRVYSPLLSTYHVAAMASIVHQQTRLPANPETQVLPLFLSHSLLFRFVHGAKTPSTPSETRDRGATLW